jgi:hypothetical protein
MEIWGHHTGFQSGFMPFLRSLYGVPRLSRPSLLLGVFADCRDSVETCIKKAGPLLTPLLGNQYKHNHIRILSFYNHSGIPVNALILLRN